MTSQISVIINQSIGKDKPVILTSVTHSGYESNLAKANAEFFSISNAGGQVKGWDYHNRPRPDNYNIFEVKTGIPGWLEPDIVLSQHKWGSFQVMQKIRDRVGVPHINLEHTLPNPQWEMSALEQMKNMRADYNVFISEYSRDAWGFNKDNSIVIRHGVDTELFNPGNRERKPVILSVVNRWSERDWCCGFESWKRVIKDLPAFPVGDTPGISSPAKDINELVSFYQSSRIFINTSTISPVPSSLLEAMSCGCAVVSTATCMIPEIIIDGYNGFITNDEEEMRNKLVLLLENPKLAEQMGMAARQSIEAEFSLDRFVQDWNRLFRSVLS